MTPTMSQTWCIFTTVWLLAVQLCIGEKSCTIWSSAGLVVQRETSFTVYCSFNCKGKQSMFSGHPPAKQTPEKLNSTISYFRVVNITENKTYSCQCNCSPALDPCGLDISTGYPPDRPKNISCIYKVKSNASGDVLCTWNKGRETFLTNTSKLWVRTVSANSTRELQVPCNRTDSQSGGFPVSTSVQLISVRVDVQNLLGSAVSSTINYTLRDIAMPSTPQLIRVGCSSRVCTLRVKQSVRTEHLEIQYTAGEQTWTTYPHQAAHMSSVVDLSISSLEPYRLYQFKARSKFATGLWSQWSSCVSNWTEEEAPAKELDVWYAEPSSPSQPLTVYWKEANVSISRGKILQYQLRAYSPDSRRDVVTNISADVRNYSVPLCSSCEVTVWARNSKGLSPPAIITTRHTEAQLLYDVKITKSKHTVTICWEKSVITPLPAAYVVEWYPEGHKAKELQWVRLSGHENHAVITDLKADDCYEGAVFVLYSGKSVRGTRFTGITTGEKAPGAGPRFEKTVEENKVTVTWTELDRNQRNGCVTKYTIYLESSSKHRKNYSVPASHRVFISENLPPESYSLWMTASTASGEGPARQSIPFSIQEPQLSLLLVFGVISVIILFVVCLCQCSAVKQRLWTLFQCLILDVVPDPANSKWAKECAQEKGKMNLQVQLRNSTTKEEEEPILVNVEELPKQKRNPPTPEAVSSQYPAQTVQSPDTELAPALYPPTTYIKSFSHDSDSSDHTQTSLDTNTTVDYISSHGQGNMDEEDEEEEEDEFGFFPSHNVFMEQFDIGGKLTLDAVKIDCSDFFQNM